MSIQSEIQIRVEDGVFKRDKADHPVIDGFRIFQFIQKSAKSGQFVSHAISEKTATNSHSRTITVFGVSKAGDVKRFVRMAKACVKDGKPMVAIVSPSVFNQPQYRDVIEGIHIPGVGVLVEEPSKFEVNHLAPWVGRILAAGKVSAGVDSAIESLDISARLRDPVSGRLDANKISDLLGLSKSDIATKICGVSRQALGQNPTSAGIQEKLRPLEDVAQALVWCGGDEAKLRAWLNRPNRDFPEVGGQVPSPIDLILLGHASVVARKVGNLRIGQPA